jgi:glycosyltransferase involved in cell wall biosynthesis
MPGHASSSLRVLVLIPAHNEATNLPLVVADVRNSCPGLDILVVDDGSDDGTGDMIDALGTRWLRWPERRGVGAAVRAGLRYADRAGFDAVVRVDADGQHDPGDVARLLVPIREGRAEVTLGTRFGSVPGVLPKSPAIAQRALGAFIAVLTRHDATDPTSGFCAFGPRAVRLLSEHHPDGYPEPELRLFLARNGARVAEVPVRSRARLNGRTSLTPARVVAASARVLLALLVVPVRPAVDSPGD